MIDVINVSCAYGKKLVMKNVNLQIEQGETIGLIGPNGSGKSTLMKIVSGLKNDYTGKVESSVKNNVGVIIEEPALYKNQKGRENLNFNASLKGVGANDVNEIIKLFELENFIDLKVSKYSLGMRQKLAVAIAFLGYPKFVILDEPTNGLDPENRAKVLDTITKLKDEKNISIFISSHDLRSISYVCDRTYMIKDKSLEELTNKNSGVITYNIITSSENVDKLNEVLIQYKYKYQLNLNEFKIETDNLDYLLRVILSNNIFIKDIAKIDLEEVYLERT